MKAGARTSAAHCRESGPGGEVNAQYRYPTIRPAVNLRNLRPPTSRSFGYGPKRERGVLLAVAGESGEGGDQRGGDRRVLPPTRASSDSPSNVFGQLAGNG